MKLLNVTKAFDKKQILNGFSYNFPKSGVIFVEGASGVGKTTLFNIIAGLLKPDSGEVELEPVSYLFQEDRLLESVSVLENVTCVNKNQKLCEIILASLGLAEELHSSPLSLSGGMKRRVAIARTLAYNAKVVLLDEPFKGLDTDTLKKTIYTIKEYTANKLLLIISHETDKNYFENYNVISL